MTPAARLIEATKRVIPRAEDRVVVMDAAANFARSQEQIAWQMTIHAGALGLILGMAIGASLMSCESTARADIIGPGGRGGAGQRWRDRQLDEQWRRQDEEQRRRDAERDTDPAPEMEIAPVVDTSDDSAGFVVVVIAAMAVMLTARRRVTA